jgi:chromosome segregation ATPase
MQRRFVRYLFLAVAALLVLNLCLIESDAQSRRKRRARRRHKPAVVKPVITNPSIAPAGSEGDARIISTADENGTGSEQTDAASENKTAPRKKTSSDPEDMQRTINSLSNQVDKLTDKLSKLQDNDRTLLEMDRLTRAEQRAENLRAQQLDTETKLADVQSRLDQIEFAVKPENIERATATYGSTRPEEAREALRRQLDAERSRLQNQVKLLENNRRRLEAAVTSADAEVDLLRRRIEAQQQDNAQTENDAAAKKSKKPE